MQWHLTLMAAFYTAAGANHFVNPRMYERIIPPFLRFKKAVNYASGIAEIVLGVLLLTPLRPQAAWGVILLLLFVFPANVYHLQQRGAGMKIPLWMLWLRLPLQAVLVWWAYQYT